MKSMIVTRGFLKYLKIRKIDQNLSKLTILYICRFTIRIGWLVVLRIYVTLAIFRPYRNVEARDNQSLKS